MKYALIPFFCCISPYLSAQEVDPNVRVKIDEGGSAQFTELSEDSSSAEEYEHALDNMAAYSVTGPLGETAFIAIPKGTSPSAWTNPDRTFGLDALDPSILKASMLSESASAEARFVMKELAEAAHAEYCNTPLRPNEFTIEVQIGASLIVSGSAKLSAKFISSDFCAN